MTDFSILIDDAIRAYEADSTNQKQLDTFMEGIFKGDYPVGTSPNPLKGCLG